MICSCVRLILCQRRSHPPAVSEDSALADARTTSWLLPPFEVLLIFAVFFLHAGWAAPDVNEAHYLSKAKHYWDPAWCRSDFFCGTADAHQFFYWTFGWLTRYLSLPAVAWTVAC